MEEGAGADGSGGDGGVRRGGDHRRRRGVGSRNARERQCSAHGGCCVDRGQLDDLRRHLFGAALQPAQTDRQGQRAAAGPGLVRRLRYEPATGWHAAGNRRRHLRVDRLEQGVRLRCAHRPDALAVRPEDPGRSGSAICAAASPIGALRPGTARSTWARSTAAWSPSMPRPASRCGQTLTIDPKRALLHHERPACRQGHGAHRRCRRRIWRARLHQRLRCRDRQARLAFLYRAGRSLAAVRERRDEEGGPTWSGELAGTWRGRYRLGRAWSTTL